MEKCPRVLGLAHKNETKKELTCFRVGTGTGTYLEAQISLAKVCSLYN